MTKPMNKQSARRRVVASKRLEPTPAPARPGEPDWREWNFAKVTESELAACCLWEYARESNTIRADCRRWTENPDPIIFGEAVIERMERLGAMLFHGYFGSEPVTYFPDPWQQLPSEIKPARTV